MEEEKYLADISEIKNMMSKSSQFISLSGLSGILAGIYALLGAGLAYYILDSYQVSKYYEIAQNSAVIAEKDVIRSLVIIAVVIVALSLITGIVTSGSKARKAGEKLWNSTSKRLAVNFMVPLASGGIFALLLIDKEYYDLIAAVTLIFYGLACVTASKYTFRDVRYLGVTIIILGLAATAFPGYSLILWAIGFGFCHIFYGSIMYYKYDRQ